MREKERERERVCVCRVKLNSQNNRLFLIIFAHQDLKKTVGRHILENEYIKFIYSVINMKETLKKRSKKPYVVVFKDKMPEKVPDDNFAHTNEINQFAEEKDEKDTLKAIEKSPKHISLSEIMSEQRSLLQTTQSQTNQQYPVFSRLESNKTFDSVAQDAELESSGNMKDEEEEENQTIASKITKLFEEDNQSDSHEEGVLLPHKVISAYVKVGELLSEYRSGPLPKPLKIIPSLQNWTDVLYVTQPESWSVQAVSEVTNIFISTLPTAEAQKFVYMVLLERFKSELDPTRPRAPGTGAKTLNPHIFHALKRSLFKPAAFFKGFLFPLAESGSCSPREALIASSIFSSVSIPALHSSGALQRLADCENYSSAISVFIKTLLEKNYALPYKVIDSLVFHFMRFKNPKDRSEKNLTIVWFQSFLEFSKRYSTDITDDQRDFLLEVLKVRKHKDITPIIRKELLKGKEKSVSNRS